MITITNIIANLFILGIALILIAIGLIIISATVITIYEHYAKV